MNLRNHLLKLTAIAALINLTGCENARIVEVGPDTYLASASSAAGAFANTSALKAGVMEDAQKFATKQGKVVVPLGVTENQPGVGFPSCDYKFMAVTPQEAQNIEMAQARQRAQQQREWNSLTPAQRIDYTLRMQEMAQRDRALSDSEYQTNSANLQGNMDRSSYDQRTRALQQPVNVNVNHSGYIDQNVSGTLDVYQH